MYSWHSGYLPVTAAGTKFFSEVSGARAHGFGHLLVENRKEIGKGDVASKSGFVFLNPLRLDAECWSLFGEPEDGAEPSGLQVPPCFLLFPLLRAPSPLPCRF